MLDEVLDYFNANAEELAEFYDTIDRKKVHGYTLEAIGARAQSRPMLNILDIGTGNGADAEMFAKMGHWVVAVDPASRLLDIARATHGHDQVKWFCDALPVLGDVQALHQLFDVIVLSSVWTYLPPVLRQESMKTMTKLLEPGGYLCMSYSSSATRKMQYRPSTASEIQALLTTTNDILVDEADLYLDAHYSDGDIGGRADMAGGQLSFETFIIRKREA